MIVSGELDGSGGEFTSARIGGDTFCREDQPGFQLRLHVARIFAFGILPHLIDFGGDAAEIGNDEIVL